MTDKLEERFVSELLNDLDHDRLVLPTLPEVALKVRDALEDDDASVGQIASVVAMDAALSARLIQVVNSPLLRASKHIDSLEAAITRMGLNMTRNMVTSMVMEQMFQATSDVTDQRLRDIWEHSTQVAAISHALAGQFTRLQPDQALLAGLVHDIGALPILSRAEDVPELLEDEAMLDRIVERAHGRIGEAILKHWGFSDDLVAVAAGHEDLQRDSQKVDYVDVVTVANLQSHLGSDHPLTRVDWSTVPAFAKLGIGAEVNVVEIEEISNDVEAVKNALGG